MENGLRLVGSVWLQRYYGLHAFELSRRSYIGGGSKTETLANGHVEQTFGTKYAPLVDDPLAHWEFALKYDDLNLSFYKAVLLKIGATVIQQYIEASPTSKYARKTGFLYEFLFAEILDIANISGNYVDVLDERYYITGTSRKESRWRINNNLLGNQQFCPIIRFSRQLKSLLSLEVGDQIDRLKDDYPSEIFLRAASYLFTKETRSSYEIEHEKPSPKRIERFIALLHQAGKSELDVFLKEPQLIALQKAIVDPRFAASGFRDFQNYIGQSLPNYMEFIHYVCPPPQYVATLMEGLSEFARHSSQVHPIVRAAVVAFGFVFIHPFEDGNGRLHRFLIHDMLVRDNVLPDGMILPVSAHMLAHMKEYDETLEAYSGPALRLLNYIKDDRGEITVVNPEEVEAYFRYPDLTLQTVYLASTIKATVLEDLPAELLFIQRYDELKREIQEVVDMPDKAINLMILFLYQNKGTFPKRRRKDFPKLTDDEITAMEKAYEWVFS